MPKIGSLMGGQFWKADHIDEEDEVRLTIKSVKVESFDNGDRPCVIFEEDDKMLVLNKINASRITKICGSDDTDDWEGHQIGLIHDWTQYQGQDVPCVRVKLEKPKKAKKAAGKQDFQRSKPKADAPDPDALDDDIPF